MKSYALLSIILVIFLCVAQANSGMNEVQPDSAELTSRIEELVAVMKDPDATQTARRNAANTVRAVNAAIIAQLLETAEHERQWPESPENSQAARMRNAREYTPGTVAIEILGDFQIPQAIPFLLDNIDYIELAHRRTHLSIFDGYPCAKALSQYRSASVAPIIAFLIQHNSEDVSDKAIELFAKLVVHAFSSQTRGWRHGLEFVERASFQRSGPHPNLLRLHEAMRKHLRELGITYNG